MSDGLLQKIATDVDWIKGAMQDGKAKFADQEKRISSLERSRHWLTGLAAGVGALVGMGTGHLPKL